MKSIDSRSWTGLAPSWGEEFGMSRAEAWLFSVSERHGRAREAAKALLMIWGPAVPNRPRGRFWTVYDGFQTQRGGDWSFCRALVSTVAILTHRRWTQRQIDRDGPKSTYDMGHWGYRNDGLGWSCRILNLYPRWRVSIDFDGDSYL